MGFNIGQSLWSSGLGGTAQLLKKQKEDEEREKEQRQSEAAVQLAAPQPEPEPEPVPTYKPQPVAPAAPAPSYVAPIQEEEQEPEPEPEAEKSFSWSSVLGYARDKGHQMDEWWADTPIYRAIVDDPEPPTYMEQEGRPAPARDLDNPYSYTNYQSYALPAVHVPETALPQTEDEPPAGQPQTLWSRAAEGIRSYLNPQGPGNTFLQGFLESGSFQLARERRAQNMAKAETWWVPDETAIVPVKEPDAASKPLRERTFRDWLAVIEVNPVSAGGRYYEATHPEGLTERQKETGETARVVGANLMFALEVGLTAPGTYAGMELTKGQLNGLLATGYIPEVEDTPYEDRYGALEPFVAAGSTLWRGLRQLVPGDSPEALEIYGPDMGIGWVTIENGGVQFNTAAFKNDVALMAEHTRAFRTWMAEIEDSNPDVAEELKSVYGHWPSDVYRIEAMTTQLMERDAQIAQMDAEMRAALARGDAVAAGALQERIYIERQKSNVDIMDASSSIAGEMVYGLVVDPTNLLSPVFKVFGFTQEGRAAAEALSSVGYSRTPEAAARLTSTVQEAEKVLESVTNGGTWRRVKDTLEEVGSSGRVMEYVKENLNPMARTPETMAASDAFNLHTAIVPMVKDLRNPSDVYTLITNLIEDPASLNKGLRGMTGASSGQVVGDLWYPTNFLHQSEAFQDSYHILKVAGQEIVGMLKEEMVKEVPDMQKIMVRMDNIIYNTGRRVYGDFNTSLIPATAFDFKVIGNDIAFLGENGDEISRITASSLDELAKWKRALEDSKNLGAGDFTLGNYIQDLVSLEKAWLSNQFLNLRPGHWVRNAVNATLALTGDNTYSFRSLAQQQEDLARIMGDIPSSMGLYGMFGMGDTAVGNLESIAPWLRGHQKTNLGKWISSHVVDPISGLGPLGEHGSKIWTGSTELLNKVSGGRWSLKFGEQSFRDTAFYSVFMRTLRKGWENNVKTQIVRQAVDAGIPEDTARAFGQLLGNHYASGKDEMLRVATEWLQKNRVPFTLNMDRYADTVRTDAGRIIEFMNDLPDNPDEARVAIDAFINRMKVNGYAPFRKAPTQPGTKIFFDKDIADDGWSFVDSLQRTMRQMGVGEASSAWRELDEFKAVVKSDVDAMLASLRGFSEDLADVGKDNALTHMYDTMWTWYKNRIDWLIDKDKIFEEAAQIGDDAAWASARTKVMERWHKYVADVDGIFGKARSAMLSPDELPDRPSSLNQVMMRLESFDALLNEQARMAGLEVRDIGRQFETFSDARDAYRELIGYGLAQAMEAYRRNPSIEGFNSLADIIMRLDDNGARLADHIGQLNDMREAGQLPQAVYRRYANNAWRQYFEQHYEYIYGTAENIYEAGLVAKVDKTNPDAMAEVARLVKQFGKNMDEQAPTPGSLVDVLGDYVPTLKDIEDWATSMGIQTRIVNADGTPGRREWRYVAKWVRENVPEIEFGSRRSVTGFTDDEMRLMFSRMIEGFDPGDLQFFAREGNESMGKLISDINRAMNVSNGNQAIDYSDVGMHTGRMWEMLRDDMWDAYNTGRSGGMRGVMELTPQQAVALQDIVRKGVGGYNDVIAAATHAARQMADHAMLDYSDRRRIDTWAQVVFPFHYFWSRSAKNWAIRVTENPAFMNGLWEYQAAKQRENNKSGVTGTMYEGTVPHPMNAFTGRKDRLADLMEFALPQYGANWFVKPQEANNQLEARVDSARQYLPGMNVTSQLVWDAAMDAWSPREDGQASRLSKYQFGDYMPLGRLANYAYIWKSGREVPVASQQLGDEWDYWRVANVLATTVEDADTQYLAGYAAQVLENRQNDRPDYDGISEDEVARIEELLPRAMQKAARNRSWSLITSNLLGASTYVIDERQKEILDAQQGYYAREWTPEQIGGSVEAQRASLDENPAVAALWSMRSLKPGAGKDVEEPAAQVERSKAWDELDAANEALRLKRSEILADDPYIGTKEMYDATRAEQERVDAAWEKIPPSERAPDGELKGNPVEMAVSVFGDIFKSAKDQFPYPESPWSDEEGAPEPSKQAVSQYYDDKAKAKALQDKYVAERLTWLLEHDDFLTANYQGKDRAWYNELRLILQGRSVETWIAQYRGRYDEEDYYNWRRSHDLISEAKDKVLGGDMEYVESLVGTQFTQQQLDAYNEYRAMPGETREQESLKEEFREEHPYISEINAAAYNREAYDEAVQVWGPDWYEKMGGSPSPESMFGVPYENMTESQRDQYYDAKNTWLVENPDAYAIQLWYYGRPRPEEAKELAKKEGAYLPPDAGVEYAEAIEQFGNDIFQIQVEEAQASLQGTKAYFAWKDSHYDDWQRIQNYKEWRGWYFEDEHNIEEMAANIVYDAAVSERDQITEAILEAESSRTVLIPGPQVAAPNWWKGEMLPGMGLVGAEGTLGAVPEDILRDPAMAALLAERGLVSGTPTVEPDPAQYMLPSMRSSAVPGMGVSWGDLVATQPTQEQRLDEIVPGLGKFIEMADEETRQAISAGRKEEPAEPLTMEKLLEKSDTYQRQVKRDKDAFVRQEFASSVFGVDPKQWNMYFSLDKGSDARKSLRNANPNLEAALLFAYNQDKWKLAQDAGFDVGDVVDWARRPEYDPDDPSSRTSFWNANPRAYMFNVWVNGRPGGASDESEDPDFSRNWGADYRTAQERYGKNIWELVVQYRSLPSGTGARSDFRKQNPQYNEWESWWYANLPGDTESYTAARYGNRGYGYAYSSWGGGGRAFSSGGGRDDSLREPDGSIYVRPYESIGVPGTPRYASQLSQTADNWRRYTSTEGSRLFQWNRGLGLG